MITQFDDPTVTVALLGGPDLPYDTSALTRTIQSVLDQDHARVDLIVVTGQDGSTDLPSSASGRVITGDFASRGQRFAAALAAAQGDFFLAIDNSQCPVILRRSAVRTFVMAALRGASPGMIYADYARVSADGATTDVHLLDWHAGRLRDTFDMGRATFFATATLKDAGGFNCEYRGADLYDLRLRVTERGPAVHIANRYAGSLYSVEESAGGHNVFDYLLADQSVQRELEHALGKHLERTGANLAPGAHVQPVSSVADHADGLIASIVIPVNNRPEFIGRAIESVQAQTVREVEVIVVVNGGPDDATVPEVRRYLPGGDRHQADAPAVHLQVVDINNLGLCLNTGIAAARGRYYVQLDSDDRLKPDAVEKLLAVFDSDPTIGMVVGSYEVWNLDEATGALSRDESIPVVTHDEWTADNGRNNLLRINGAGAPRAAHTGVIRACGWFGVNDTASCRNYGEDYDLVLRISERFTIGRVWDPIYEVIRHSGGTDHSIDQATVDRNDNAKDQMRLEALHRRQALNAG
jgi:glycosyltransferase involved in cell wall biosynthesis